MAGSRKNRDHKIALFPFLSVLICTIGVLTLILISSVLGQVDAVVDTAKMYKGIVRELGDINRQVSMLDDTIDRQRERDRNLKVDMDEAKQLLGELGRIDEGKHQGMYHALTNTLKKTQDAQADIHNIKVKIKIDDPDGIYRGNATPDAIKELAGLKKKLNATNLEKNDAEARIGILTLKKKGIEKEIVAVKKELDKEDPSGKLRKKTAASREKLKRIEEDLRKTNAKVEQLKVIIPDTNKKLEAAQVTLDKLPAELNIFGGGTGVGFKSRYVECTKDWVKLDPDRKGGGELLKLTDPEDGRISDSDRKFRTFLREVKAERPRVKLVLLIRPSGVKNYQFARDIAKVLGLKPGYLALPREDMKIPIKAEK